MKVLVFFLVTLSLGTANPIGPTMTYTESSRDELVRSAVNNNVHWLLSGIRDGTLEGPDLARAVVALFLAEPGFFSPGNEIGQEMRDKIKTAFTELIRQARIEKERLSHLHPWRRLWRVREKRNGALSFIPSEELALFVQALLVSCANPYGAFGYDLTNALYESVLNYHCEPEKCHFPSSAMLALCNARATSSADVRIFHKDAMDNYGGVSSSIRLTDEEAFHTMTIGCYESSNFSYPTDMHSDVRLRKTRRTLDNQSEYIYSDWLSIMAYSPYPFNLTVEDFRELMRQEGDPMENTTSLSSIAAAMQNLMYIHRLRVSDLPLGVDFLLKSQDEDGSWGQSALNSFLVLPVLSNRSFLDINSDHCPEGSSENETLMEQLSVFVAIQGDIYSYWYSPLRPYVTLYKALTETHFADFNVIYHNGTDGKPYIRSLKNRENNPETGYFWFTYEQTRWPKESLTILTQSHADIKLKPSSRYFLWYRRKSEEEAQND